MEEGGVGEEVDSVGAAELLSTGAKEARVLLGIVAGEEELGRGVGVMGAHVLEDAEEDVEVSFVERGKAAEVEEVGGGGIELEEAASLFA